MERAMGIEPIANSLSPVESVGLTLLEDRIWAGKMGILRPSCAQIFPSPKNLADGIDAKKSLRFGRNSGLREPAEKSSAQVLREFARQIELNPRGFTPSAP